MSSTHAGTMDIDETAPTDQQPPSKARVVSVTPSYRRNGYVPVFE